MDKNFNLPPGCSVSDIPGNRPTDSDEPYCEHLDCYEILQTDQELRMGLCTKHIKESLDDVE